MKLKLATLILAITTIGGTSKAQELNENSFDFWIGNWEVVWNNPDGTEVKGTNEIVRIANQKVIQENFKDPSTNFEGTSISVYSPTSKTWNQAWADSSGAYLEFTGDLIDGEPSFKTRLLKRGEEMILQRMVFKHIKENSFTWIWEGTKNGGQSWNQLWKIKYRRL